MLIRMGEETREVWGRSSPWGGKYNGEVRGEDRGFLNKEDLAGGKGLVLRATGRLADQPEGGDSCK